MVKNAYQLLENSCDPTARRAREILVDLVDAAIGSADPSLAIKRCLKLHGDDLSVSGHKFDLSRIGKVVVVGGGKASGAMAHALWEIMGEKISGGVICVPQAAPSKDTRINFIEAGHPIPTESGVAGTALMMDLLRDLGSDDLAICLISGGGSALMPLPSEGLTLKDLGETTHLLLRSGATIQELNAVRKHLSAVKGGQMAQVASPAKIVALIISDVVGDRLDTIASGPTVQDHTTFGDALSVLKKYELLDRAPPQVISHLKEGMGRNIPETPKSGLGNAFNRIIASNADALRATGEEGRTRGLNVHIVTNSMEGEAREVGANLSHIIGEVLGGGKPIRKPALLLSGGETTVTVKGRGKGGRNQELALSASLGISDVGVAIASFSTDGIDGPTEAAGAIADGFTLLRARRKGLDPLAYLEDNDSYHFFSELGDLLVTGPTGTNVMDITALVIL